MAALPEDSKLMAVIAAAVAAYEEVEAGELPAGVEAEDGKKA